MRFALLAALALCLAGPAAAAYEDEGLPEVPVPTETVKNGEEEEDLALIQASEEDLAAFVMDYIRKDIQLKGAFLIEDKASKKVLRLELASIEPKAAAGGSRSSGQYSSSSMPLSRDENGGRTVAANFKDAAGKKTAVVFHLQNGPWGGLDIFRIELKAPPAGKAGKKKGA